MAGFESSIFVDIPEDYLKELLCLICGRVLNTPITTGCCQKTFCKACIGQWLKIHNTCPNDKRPMKWDDLHSPPSIMVNFIGNLKIKCQCKEVIKVSQVDKHNEQCPRNVRLQCQYCKSFKHEHDEFACNKILAKLYHDTLDKLNSSNEQVAMERKEHKEQVERLVKRFSHLEANFKMSKVNLNQSSNHSVNDVEWVKAKKGVIPRNAVSGGFTDNGETLHVGRAMYNGILMPGKVIASQGLCYVSHFGREHAIASYEVLVNSSQAKLIWVSKTCSDVNTIHVTNPSGDAYLIGRGYYQGSMVVGKVDDLTKVLFITSKGSEISLNDYDVLAIE